MKILYEDFIFEFGVHVFKSRGARHVLDPDVAVFFKHFMRFCFDFMKILFSDFISFHF